MKMSFEGQGKLTLMKATKKPIQLQVRSSGGLNVHGYPILLDLSIKSFKIRNIQRVSNTNIFSSQ